MINHHATALNLSSVLEHYASLTPDRVAVTCAGRHMTYGELNAAAAQVAEGLSSLGIAAGDHVALLLDPVEAEDRGGALDLGFQAVKPIDPGHPV